MKRDLYFSKPIMNVAGLLGFSPDFRNLEDLGSLDSVTISVQGDRDLRHFHGVARAGPAEVPLLLVGLARRQMAGAGLAVLGLSPSAEAEAFLRPLMGLHLGHG